MRLVLMRRRWTRLKWMNWEIESDTERNENGNRRRSRWDQNLWKTHWQLCIISHTANANAMCTAWTLNSQIFDSMTHRLVENILQNFNAKLAFLQTHVKHCKLHWKLERVGITQTQRQHHYCDEKEKTFQVRGTFDVSE